MKSDSHSSKKSIALLILASLNKNLIIEPELLTPKSGKLTSKILTPSFAAMALASIVLPVPEAPASVEEMSLVEIVKRELKVS